MKIIDLLNKIANGEDVPRELIYKGFLWEYDVNNKMWFYYFGEGRNHRFDRLFYIGQILNDEVEILDEPKEDKIEKVDTYVLCDSDFHTRYKDGYSLKATEIIDKAFEEYSYKINELIDEVNKLKEK